MNHEAEAAITYCKDPGTIQHYLYNNNIIAFIVIVVALITAEFWFETFHQIVRDITGQEIPAWYYMMFAAIIWTFILFIIAVMIFKIPIAASYTL